MALAGWAATVRPRGVRIASVVSAVVLTLVGLEATTVQGAPAAAPNGDLDAGFSGDGVVFRDIGGGHDEGIGIVVSSSGGLVTLARQEKDFSTPNTAWQLNRFTDAGELDTSFGIDGAVMPSEAMVTAQFVPAALVQTSAGGLVVMGVAANRGAFIGSIAFARYLSTGQPDLTFGSDGFLVSAARDADPRVLALDSSGRLIVGGYFHFGPSNQGRVWRFNTDGGADTSFGSGGAAAPHGLDSYPCGVNSVLVQPDGRILAGGVCDGIWMIARLTVAGETDTSWGGDGSVRSNSYGFTGADGLGVGPDGSVVGVGGTGDVAVARYKADGTLDPTFGSGGEALYDFGGSEHVSSLSFDGAGGLLLAGAVGQEDAPDFGLIRLLGSNGAVDTNFGTSGLSRTDLGGADEARDLVVDELARPVAVGTGGANGDLAIVRYAAGSTTTAPPTTAVPAGALPSYWLAAADGGVFSFGTPFLGSAGGLPLNTPIVGMAATPSDAGYWLVAADGGVFAFGDADFFGSLGNVHLAQPIVGLAATPSGAGYWLIGRDGGVFAFGDAPFFGSTGGVALTRPVVGMAATPSGQGYWLVAADGGVFTYGDAAFYGSTGDVPLVQPIAGMAPTKDGRGYWLVGADGGAFTYGAAAFYGSTGGLPLVQPIVAMLRSPTGNGYALLAADGGVFAFGDQPFLGSLGGVRLVAPIIGGATSQAS